MPISDIMEITRYLQIPLRVKKKICQVLQEIRKFSHRFL